MTKGVGADFSNDTATGSVGGDNFVIAGTAPTLSWACGYTPVAITSGTPIAPVITEAYVAEVAVIFGSTITGIAVHNGSAVSGNYTVYLADSTGVVLASSASTAQAGVSQMQKFPFSTPYVAKSGKYYIAVTVDNTTARLQTLPISAGNAGKLTGLTYGTFPNFTPPSTFTAGLGPISALY